MQIIAKYLFIILLASLLPLFAEINGDTAALYANAEIGYPIPENCENTFTDCHTTKQLA